MTVADDDNVNLELSIWADAHDIYFEGVMTDKTSEVRKDVVNQIYYIRNDFDDEYKQQLAAGSNPSIPSSLWDTGVDFEYRTIRAQTAGGPEMSTNITGYCGYFVID